MEEEDSKLHILMFPWLAMGHLIPFLELSISLAQKGHKITFLSTPRNIKRLPQIPTTLSPLINLVHLSLPYVEGLLANAEATIDLPITKVPYLKKAFDGLQRPFADLLEDLIPDWIIYDFASYWLPPMATKLGIPSAFFSLFNASSVAYFGPLSAFMGDRSGLMITREDGARVPNWMPIDTKVLFRGYEVRRIMISMGENVADVDDGYRYVKAVEGSNVVFIRSCREFERDWLHLVEKKILRKPVIPVGVLPRFVQQNRDDDEVAKWTETGAWLSKHSRGTVVYVALGTEAMLTQEEVNELAFGLELANLPFLWVLRKPPGSGEDFALPIGFEDRVSDRGFICKGWAPQVRILAHPSVGGFLTHCGWNSIIESLGLGRPLILLPMISEQALNARVLVDRNIGLEILKDNKDGSFTRESVSESVRTVMTEEKGEIFRSQAREMKKIFGNMVLHDRYLDDVVQYLRAHTSLQSFEHPE